MRPIFDTLPELSEKAIKNCKLSHLLQTGNNCDGRKWFNDPFVTREQWSFVLGINRATLYRWQQVIESDRLLNYLYKPSNSSRFTAHQGAILLIFARFKASLTYSEVIEKFKSPLEGKPLWWYLQKEKFYQWLNGETNDEKK